jgi:Flp pilus assembly protein protease CpaA
VFGGRGCGSGSGLGVVVVVVVVVVAVAVAVIVMCSHTISLSNPQPARNSLCPKCSSPFYIAISSPCLCLVSLSYLSF